MTVTIYGLTDPRTGTIRYVGKTVNCLAQRRSEHIGDARRGRRSHKASWLRSLQCVGLSPGIVPLEKTTDLLWQQAEKIWIAKLPGLVNHHAGGTGTAGRVLSAATREKIRQSNLRTYAEKRARGEVAEMNRQASLRAKGRPSPNKGKVFSSEARAKMSAAKKGKPWSAARRVAYERSEGAQ